MLRNIGKYILKFCDNNNKYNINTELCYNINFNIYMYINKLIIETKVYNYLKKINLINKNINNYNIKFQLIKGNIFNFQLKIYYDINYVIFKYAILPIDVFEKNIYIKIENYDINYNKLDEINIYNSKDYIIYNILEYIINIDSKLLFNNYNIEIYNNIIIFNLI